MTDHVSVCLCMCFVYAGGTKSNHIDKERLMTDLLNLGRFRYKDVKRALDKEDGMSTSLSGLLERLEVEGVLVLTLFSAFCIHPYMYT